MSNEVANFIPFEATRVGWTPSKELDWDEYISVGKDIACAEAATQWWIGDWYNQGYAYGEHEAACIAAGIDYANARKCASVCKSFELLRRRNNVSFSHHQEIARIDDVKTQEKLLDLCDPGEDGPEIKNVKALREVVSSFKGLPPPTAQEYTLSGWAVSMNTMLYAMSFKPAFKEASSEELAKHLLSNVESLFGASDNPAALYREQVVSLRDGASRVVEALDLINENPTVGVV